ncbi:MAG: STAS domain-containing protein [Methanoregulaceae archaeon]
MEIRTERTRGVLVFTLNGRLDGFGAGILQDTIRKEVKDDDRAVVLDLELVPYLSSAGIRVFLSLKNEIKKRKGFFALCNTSGYPLKVLESAGFLSVLERYSSADAAIAASQKPGEPLSVIEEALTRPVIESGVRYSFGPTVDGRAILRITGDVRDVLYSRLTESKIQEKRFSDIRYSLGLGGLGENLKVATPILGEMITLHGSLVWQPTDGNNTPDFFAPTKDTGLVTAYTGFNVTLDGPFHDVIDLEIENEEGITLTDLYRFLFRYAKENRRQYHGIISVVMWAVTGGVASSALTRSPLQKYAPPDGALISDPAYVEDWLSIDPGPSYAGDTMVGFGIGIDRSADLSRFDPETLESLCYVHPANQGRSDTYLHNHGVIFRNIPWDRTHDLNQQIRRIVEEGEFVDMRHLLDTTRIRKAKVGVSYISSLEKDTST